MRPSPIGASARSFANLLTGVLCLFGAWGWISAVPAWPPTIADCGYLTLAGVALVSQQLANASSALANGAMLARRWGTMSLGLAVAIIFAGVVFIGVERAWSAAERHRQLDVAAPIAAEVAALEREVAANEAALRAIPAAVPGSRIAILQAPLREAIARAEARLERRRADYMAALAPRPGAEVARGIVAALAFVEPALYWLLAASEAGGVPLVPSPAPSVPKRRPDVPAQRASASRRPLVPPGLSKVFKGPLASVAMLAPDAVALRHEPPPRELASVVQAPRRPPSTDVDAVLVRDTVPSRGWAPELVGRPAWLGAALALRQAGQTIRAIGAQLDVPKSTVGRWLQRATRTRTARQ